MSITNETHYLLGCDCLVEVAGSSIVAHNVTNYYNPNYNRIYGLARVNQNQVIFLITNDFGVYDMSTKKIIRKFE